MSAYCLGTVAPPPSWDSSLEQGPPYCPKLPEPYNPQNNQHEEETELYRMYRLKHDSYGLAVIKIHTWSQRLSVRRPWTPLCHREDSVDGSSSVSPGHWKHTNRKQRHVESSGKTVCSHRTDHKNAFIITILTKETRQKWRTTFTKWREYYSLMSVPAKEWPYLLWFEAELVHGPDSSDEIVLSVFGTVFPLLQHRSHCKHQEEQKVT